MFLLADGFVSPGISVDHEWPSAVVPIIGNNNDGSLAGHSGVAELVLRVSFSFDR